MHLPTASVAQSVSIEQEDKSDNIRIATWILLGITVAVFIARQIMKAVVFRRVALDDIFIILATVFAVGLSITTSILASEGLGVLGQSTIERANILMKGYYASEFLYISSLCFSKLSLLVLFYTVVVVQRIQRRLMLGFGTFIFTWSMVSLFVVAFQCELPRPWEMMTLRCFNTRAFWIIYCIVDMSTEVSIIMLSVNLVAYLRVRSSRKIAVVACFAPRAFVIAASLVRLIWLYPITPHNDPEFRLWLPAIFSQLHACLSICTACIPYMIPFFRTLDGSLRRTHSSKSPEFRMDNRGGQTPSSLWFRRHSKTKVFNSWDSTAVASLQYERVPEASPQIPVPRPISPLTTPRYHSRPSTAMSRSPIHKVLSIRIPERDSPLLRATDVASPQTASSFALSPSCASPSPLISMQSFIPTRKAPTPPLKTYSPSPPTASSRYSSRSPSPIHSGRPPRFSLFPQQSSQDSRSSPDLRHSGFTPVSIPPVRALRFQAADGVARQPSVLLPYLPTYNNQDHTRLRSGVLTPKFSTAPYPTSPPSTTTSPISKRRHISVQELNSPMGAAINHYFNSATPETEAPEPLHVIKSAPLPSAAPLHSCLQRNQQVLSPANTLRMHKALPASPLPGASRQDVSRNELHLPHDSIIMARASRSSKMPAVRDARSSPRIVVRDLS